MSINSNNKTTKPVTSSHIAKALGIAQSTVSRALSGHPDVSEKTRAEVRAMADRLGYTPNLAARSLVQRRSGTLGLLVQPNIRSRGYDYIHRVLREFAIYSSKRGLNICVDYVRETEKEITVSLKRGRVDGIVIAYASNVDRIVETMDKLNLPFIFLRRRSQAYPEAAFVDTQDASGAKALVHHLYELGHRRIAYIGTRTQPNEARIKGYVDGCKKLNLNIPEDWVIQKGETSERIESVSSILRRPHCPTALVCYDDLIAAEIIAWSKSQGIRVPSDLSVTGFGDEDIAFLIDPTLTTIRLPIDNLVRMAVDSLVQSIEHNRRPHIQETIPVQLIARNSTAPPPETSE